MYYTNTTLSCGILRRIYHDQWQCRRRNSQKIAFRSSLGNWGSFCSLNFWQDEVLDFYNSLKQNRRIRICNFFQKIRQDRSKKGISARFAPVIRSRLRNTNEFKITSSRWKVINNENPTDAIYIDELLKRNRIYCIRVSLNNRTNFRFYVFI